MNILDRTWRFIRGLILLFFALVLLVDLISRSLGDGALLIVLAAASVLSYCYCQRRRLRSSHQRQSPGSLERVRIDKTCIARELESTDDGEYV